MPTRQIPYREASPAWPADGLPPLLTRPIADLVAEDAAGHAARHAPKEWIAHVDRWIGDTEPRTRPRGWPIFFAALYWTTVGVSAAWTAANITDKGKELAICWALLWLVLSGWLTEERAEHWCTSVNDTGIKAIEIRKPLWWLVHLAFLPTSLLFTGREFVAWARWRLGGSDWTVEGEWHEGDAIARAFDAFAEALRTGPRAALKRHPSTLEKLSREAGTLKTNARVQAETAANASPEGDTFLAQSQRLSARFCAERAAACDERATRLSQRVQQATARLARVDTLTQEYRRLVEGRANLARAGILDPLDDSDGRLRAQLAEAYAALAAAIAETDEVPTAVRVETADEATEEPHETAHAPVPARRSA